MITNIKLIILLLFYSTGALAVCATPISRTNINGGEIPTSTKLNADFDVLYAKANTLPGDCIADNSILEQDITDGAVTTAKIADATIQLSKFAEGVFPSFGKPLRIKAYTASGSWVKGNDVGFVHVQVIGGGGGAGKTATNGGTSSFGAHCVAGGGYGASTATGGAGGTASSGDINLSGIGGGNGTMSSGTCFQTTIGGFDGQTFNRLCFLSGKGGASMYPRFGRGGMRFMGRWPGTVWGGGGSGAYCAKIIQRVNLADSIAVTIGTGGTQANDDYPAAAGTSGLVLVYEYAK